MEDHDDIPTSDEMKRINAEMRHDYGLRYLEDRGVRYEDEATRAYDKVLDEAAGRGKHQQQDRDKTRRR
jgi:hypothetical protein